MITIMTQHPPCALFAVPTDDDLRVALVAARERTGVRQLNAIPAPGQPGKVLTVIKLRHRGRPDFDYQLNPPMPVGTAIGWQGTWDALEFVQLLWKADHIPGVCLENPRGIINSRLPFMPRPQVIQPYEFGDDASKATCLFLRGLQPLPVDPAARVPGRRVEWPRGSGKMVERWSNQTDSGQNKLPPSADRALKRSVTYPGPAAAMALNWG